MSERQQALKKWVLTRLAAQYDCIVDDIEIISVAGDASFRRYFRVIDRGQSYVIMDAPPEHEDCLPFVQIASQWRLAGVRVPKILAKDLQQGFLLLEDFGDQLLHTHLTAATVDALYGLAMNELQTIQALPTNALPVYDASVLLREMSLFRDWFLTSWLQIELNDAENTLLSDLEQTLIRAALSQPQVVVHRDYHSRNLMVLENGAIGVIDFQDAVIGAASYDLVSLLRDSYIHWPEDRIQAWVEQFYFASPWITLISLEAFKKAFDWMGMQRQLKVCGIFVRLSQRDGKIGYLQNIPLTFRNLLESASRYPELAQFSNWLVSRVLPELLKRPEFHDLSPDFWERGHP